MGVIYITHRLEELRAIGDRVTILRDGATVHTGPLAEVSTDRIIQHMVGREMVVDLPAAARRAGRGTAARRRTDARRRIARCLVLAARGRDRGPGRADRRGPHRNLPRHLRRGPIGRRRDLRGRPRRADRLAARSGGGGDRAGHRGPAEDGPGAAAAHRLQHHHGEPAGHQPLRHRSTGARRAASRPSTSRGCASALRRDARRPGV